ncbi:hypothetical protein NP014_23780, partial [Salmonella enterica]|nr:hypothetical protein [Salmonella enterica]
SLKTSIKTITYLSDIGCLEIQGASLLPEAMISIKKHDIEHIISQKSGDSSFLPANVFYNPPILIRGYLIWASKIVYS